MLEDPLALLVIAWAGVIAMVSLYYIRGLLGKIEEVEFRE
jgi:hypothetical protein